MAIDTSEFIHTVKTNLKANEDYTRFYYNFKHLNKKHRAIIDYTGKSWSKRDRIRYAEAELLEAKENAHRRIDTSITVDGLVKKYLDTLPEGKYKKERSSYYDRKVKRLIGKRAAIDVLADDIQQIVNSLIKKGDSPSTVKQTKEVLSPAFEIGIANKVLTNNPCLHVKITIPEQKKIVVDALERLKECQQAINEEFASDPFYRAFYLFALHGRRMSEIRNLRAEDVQLEKSYYVLRKTKSNQEQKYHLPDSIKECLVLFMERSGYVFESKMEKSKGQPIGNPKKQTIKLKKRLGDWFSLHTLRNVLVSAMAEEGTSPTRLSGALGHKDATTVNKYLTMAYLTGSKEASDLIGRI